jgi:hypothetical protein
MLTTIVNAICVILSIFGTYFSIKTYRLVRDKNLLIIIAHVTWAGLTRFFMLLCNLGSFPISLEITSSFLVITYILFVLAMYGLYRAVVELKKKL